MEIARILLVSDTHLGFDLPFKPRIQRRRRGPDFFSNYKQALKPALRGEVTCVIHGGDLFYRSKVPQKLIEMGFAPLMQVADLGIPVYLVPGNHERSAIPQSLFTLHPNIFIFNTPRVFLLKAGGLCMGFAGFPFTRDAIRSRFIDILEQTRWREHSADIWFLCVHQCVEGATVGPSNYMFRHGSDVIRLGNIPDSFAAVFSGHIHRHQILKKDLKGDPIQAPVFYPGSVERTSFAEKDEKKGYFIIDVGNNGAGDTGILNWTFHQLPARPMFQLDLLVDGKDPNEIMGMLVQKCERLPADSVIKLKIHGIPDNISRQMLRAASLRSILPPSMNVSISIPGEKRHW